MNDLALVEKSGIVPPNSLEAEQAVLGSVMLDNEALFSLPTGFRSDDFYRAPHQVLFAAMLEMAEAKEPIDAVTLTAHLRSAGKLEEAKGASYVSGLPDTVVIASRAAHYAAIVLEHSRRRSLVHAYDTARRIAQDDTCSLEKVESAVASLMLQVEDRVSAPKVLTEQEIVKSYMRHVEDSYDKPDVRAFVTEIRPLDEILWVNSTDLVVLAGRPGTGKSVLASMLAWRVSKTVGPAMFVGVEMTHAEMMQRRLMDVGSLELADVRKPRTDEAMDRLGRAADEVYRKSKVRHFKYRDLSEILREARRMKRREGLSVLVIDYLQRLDLGEDRWSTRDQRIGEATRRLKDFADDNGVPVILLSQLSRYDKQGQRPGATPREAIMPRLSDLRESGNIEADANAVVLLHIPGKIQGSPEWKAGDRRKTLAIIAKQRSGPSGQMVELCAVFEFARFSEPPPEQQPEKKPPAPQPKPQKSLPMAGADQTHTRNDHERDS